jgi:hypothetical protein
VSTTGFFERPHPPRPPLRVNDSIGVTAGTQGTFQVTFRAPPLGRVANTSVTVPNAPSGAAFGAFLAGGSFWTATWGGAAPQTTIQQVGMEDLTVTGAGLVPGAQYLVTRQGQEIDEEPGAFLFPTPSPGPSSPLPPSPSPGGGGTGPNPPPPPAPTPPGTLWDPTAGSATVTTVSTTIADVSAFYAQVVEVIIGNPAGGQTVWLALGEAASVGNGIPLDGGQKLHDTIYLQSYRGIVAAGSQELGVEILQRIA